MIGRMNGVHSVEFEKFARRRQRKDGKAVPAAVARPSLCLRLLLWAIPLGIALLLWAVLGGVAGEEVERLRVNVLSESPHDSAAFTQGLVVEDGTGELARLFESTGLYGQSTLREVGLRSGEVLRSVSLPADHFGEGLALVGDRLIQLTWREGVAHVYDRDTFEKTGQFTYSGEGWGLCYDGRRLMMSDGSAKLFFRSPETFELQGSVEVTLDGRPQRYLNELEFVGGRVYANVWYQDIILEIDPAGGKVTAVIDASGLLAPEERPAADVLNGIAYSHRTRTFFITGKRWPRMFEVTFVPE